MSTLRVRVEAHTRANQDTLNDALSQMTAQLTDNQVLGTPTHTRTTYNGTTWTHTYHAHITP